jgi:hypothetical protein
MRVYLEVGQRKTFAVALDWMGLARSGKSEDEALEALLVYVPRYIKSMGKVGTGLKTPPKNAAALDVVDRLEGNATTDFGAPGVVSELDRAPVSGKELDALIGQLRAAWSAFGTAADRAEGVELGPSGPRGGGRSLEKMRHHVAEADGGYTSALGGKAPRGDSPWSEVQDAFVQAVRARAAGELPDVGPRGGQRWPARFAIRRSAWHALDHAWEIKDRAP